MNNLFSYCGLVDAKISASEKDLHVSIAYTSKYAVKIEYLEEIGFSQPTDYGHTIG
jgi:hypothetical protein